MIEGIEFLRNVNSELVRTRSLPDVGMPERPEKVFIGMDGDHFEYSFEDPRIADLFNGFYCDDNFLSLYYCLPEVASAVDQIASRVADACWQLKREGDDEIDYNNRYFNQLFSTPNPLVNSFRDMIHQAVVYEITRGKQFFQANSGSLPPYLENVITWSNLPADKTMIDLDESADPYTITSIGEYIKQYRVPKGHSKWRVFEADKVLPILHYSLHSGNDPRKTISPLAKAAKAISNLIPVYEARGVIFIKKGPLGFFVSEKGDQGGGVALKAHEKKEVNEAVNSAYGLNRHKNQIGILSAPVKWVANGSNIKDLQPFDETLADAVAIYAALGIPRHLVPSKDTSTFANAESDTREFYSGVILPWAKKYADSFTTFFKLNDPSTDPRKRRYIDANYDHIPSLQEDKQKAAQTASINGQVYLQRFLNGVCTLNDWIIAAGSKKITNDAIYDKRLLDMDEVDLNRISKALNFKVLSMQQTNNNGSDPTPEN